MARTGSRNPVDKKAAAAEARRQAEARSLRNRRILIGGVVALALVGLIVFLANRPKPPDPLIGLVTLPSLGNAHIDPTAPAPVYNSNPPTSGPHAPSPAPCGIYREAPSDIVLVHDLEHGVAIISYDPSISDADRQKLEDFGRGTDHIIVTPHEGMDHKIGLTAWTKLLTLDTVDVPTISAFYAEFAAFGPEQVPCPFQVDQSQG